MTMLFLRKASYGWSLWQCYSYGKQIMGRAYDNDIPTESKLWVEPTTMLFLQKASYGRSLWQCVRENNYFGSMHLSNELEIVITKALPHLFDKKIRPPPISPLSSSPSYLWKFFSHEWKPVLVIEYNLLRSPLTCPGGWGLPPPSAGHHSPTPGTPGCLALESPRCHCQPLPRRAAPGYWQQQ